MLKRISNKEIERLSGIRAMFPEDWCQTQLETDQKEDIDISFSGNCPNCHEFILCDIKNYVNPITKDELIKRGTIKY